MLKNIFLVLCIVSLVSNFPIPYNIKGTACIKPHNQIQISSSISSRITNLIAQNNNFIHKNDCLISLSNEVLNQELFTKNAYYQKTLSEFKSVSLAKDEHSIMLKNIELHSIGFLKNEAYKKINEAQITSPINGIIAMNRNISSGESINKGDILLSVIDPFKWNIKALIREQDIILINGALKQKSKLNASLTLNANPTNNYNLYLENLNQIITEKSDSKSGFRYFADFTLANNNIVLKDEYKGVVSIKTGYKPLYYVLFRDFFEYIKSLNT